MQRIVIVIVLSGFLAACQQQAPAAGEAGTAAAELDFIEAVPIDEDAPPPVVQPEPAAKKAEPQEDRAEPDTAETEAEDAPVRTPTPEPAAPANDATTATRRANEAVAPRSATEVPYSPN